MYVNPVGIDIIHILKSTASVLAKLHNISHIIARSVNMGVCHGFFRLFNKSGVGVICRIVYTNYFSVCFCNFVNNTRSSCNNIQIVFAFKSFLYDFHMQKPQKSASETKPQRNRSFGFIRKSRIVKLQFFKSIPQIGIFRTVGRVNSAEYHRLN